MSNIGLITSGYNSLNGLGGCYGNYYGGGLGYGGYGGVCSTANAEQAKERIANNYDVYATQQSYKSKQGIESVNYDQQCALLYSDLKAGEADQASERFEEMVNQMKNSSQYASYSDDEIRSLVRSQYTNATGSDLTTDIKKNSSSAFAQGLKRGIPVFGLLAQKNSEADLISQTTGSSQSTGERVGKTVGTITGAALGTGGLYAAGYGIHKSGIINTVVNSKIVKNNKLALGIMAGIATVAGIASLFGSSHGKTDKIATK